jgi:N-acetylneuraminic acid mutarotase
MTFASACRRNFVIAALAILSANGAWAQAVWTKAAPFPEPDEELYGVAANGKMYVIGGFGRGRPVGMVYEYDPAGDSWMKKASMGRAAHHSALAEVGGMIYVFGGFVRSEDSPTGGWEPIDNVWEFDPAKNTWRALTPLPRKRGAASAVSVDGKIYVLGGATTAAGSKDAGISGTGPARSVGWNEMYDPVTNTWATMTEMPTPRNHMFAGAVNGKIYAMGGRLATGFITAASNTDVVEEFDPATNMWGGVKTRMPTPRSGGGSGTYGGKIYAAGGEVATPQLVGAFRAVEAYDPATNSWVALPPMPMPRHGVAGAVVGNRFRLVSGMVTSAAVGAGQDPGLQLHTTSHDVLELR